jgi:hypothetical protein
MKEKTQEQVNESKKIMEKIKENREKFKYLSEYTNK